MDLTVDNADVNGLPIKLQLYEVLGLADLHIQRYGYGSGGSSRGGTACASDVSFVPLLSRFTRGIVIKLKLLP